jgi:hypothetical protein
LSFSLPLPNVNQPVGSSLGGTRFRINSLIILAKSAVVKIDLDIKAKKSYSDSASRQIKGLALTKSCSGINNSGYREAIMLDRALTRVESRAGARAQ